MAKKNLYLTSVSLVPSHEGEKKIMKAAEKLKSRNKGTTGGIYRDEYGRSEEDYENLNIPLPKNFYKNIEDDDIEIDENDNIFLDPTELEYEYGDVIVPLDSVDFVIDNPEIGSLIYTKAGNVVHVEETAEEVYFYMTLMQMSGWERFKSYVLAFFARFKKEQKQEEIILELDND
jgi:hypothetical protein